MSFDISRALSVDSFRPGPDSLSIFRFSWRFHNHLVINSLLSPSSFPCTWMYRVITCSSWSVGLRSANRKATPHAAHGYASWSVAGHPIFLPCFSRLPTAFPSFFADSLSRRTGFHDHLLSAILPSVSLPTFQSSAPPLFPGRFPHHPLMSLQASIGQSPSAADSPRAPHRKVSISLTGRK